MDPSPVQAFLAHLGRWGGSTGPAARLRRVRQRSVDAVRPQPGWRSGDSRGSPWGISRPVLL